MCTPPQSPSCHEAFKENRHGLFLMPGLHNVLGCNGTTPPNPPPPKNPPPVNNSSSCFVSMSLCRAPGNPMLTCPVHVLLGPCCCDCFLFTCLGNCPVGGCLRLGEFMFLPSQAPRKWDALFLSSRQQQ